MFKLFFTNRFQSLNWVLLIVAALLSVAPAAANAEPLKMASLEIGGEVAVRRPSRRTPRRPRRPAEQQSRRPAPPRKLPPNRVQPGGGLNAAARACEAENDSLTALVPVENPVFTASATPSFLFYFPDTPDSIDYAEFTMLTADEKTQVYAEQFMPSAAGIVRVSLPAEASQALQVGEAYHWYLNVHCQASENVLTVDGWAQRVAAPSEVDVAEGSELPPVWYDAIALASESVTGLSVAEPAQQQWESLLRAAGLSELVDVPVLEE